MCLCDEVFEWMCWFFVLFGVEFDCEIEVWLLFEFDDFMLSDVVEWFCDFYVGCSYV